MDPVPPAENNSQWETVSARSNNKTPIVIGVILLILLLAGGAYLYRSGYNLQLGPINLGQTPTLTPTSEDYEASYKEFARKLENCEITSKEGNPIVFEVDTSSDTHFGRLSGNIMEVNFDGNKSATVRLASYFTEQIYTFDVKNAKGLIRDNLEKKVVDIQALKEGQAINVTYNCSPKEPPNTRFQIAEVTIVKKR